MDSHAVVDQIVQSLSFEVEAVPKHKTVELTSASKSTPLNVKIRVRKKDDLSMRHGVISIPKFDDSESIPQKIRLVNSDQTIMSFDVFMEADIEKTSKRKPRKNIFDMMKPGICLGAPDDDDYPYMPSSSYSANVTEDNTNSKSDGVLKHNFTLSKNTYDQYGDPTKGKKFLGKCKPGGCLDPPFGEDKYSYKPVIRKPFANEENTLKKENVQESEAKFKGRRSSVFDSGIFKKKRKTSDQSTGTKGSSSIKGNQSNSILNLYQVESTVNSLSTTQSNYIITYPPALTSSELPISDERNRSRVSSEEKSRKSFNELKDIYFIPPKGINKMRDKKNSVKSDTNDNTLKLQETDKENKKNKPIDTLKVPMPIPIPIDIPIKFETAKHETTASDVGKANEGDIRPKLSDSKLSLDPKSNKDIRISAVVVPSSADHSHPEKGKDDNIMEAKYLNIGDFDKIKQNALSDTDFEHIDSSPISKIQQHLPKQEEGLLNKNASIEGSHTKDSSPYSSNQKKGGLPNKNASIEGPHIKHSPEHIPKQEEEGLLNKNASIEGSHTKGSPQYTSKQKEGGLPNKNASIEGPHIKHSPEHIPKQEEEGPPNKNASIEGSHTKGSPQYSSKQKEGRLPNKNASIEGPYIKHSPEHLPKQEEEGLPNKNASIEGSHTKDSPPYSSNQKEGGLPNKNASIEGPHIKHSPEHIPKQEEEGPPNKNASIEGSHTKGIPQYSSKQKEGGLPNKNASIEGPHIKHSPEHLPKQEEEGLLNKNASIEGSHTKDSSPYSSNQKKGGLPNKNASIEGPHIKHSPEHIPKQEEEGPPNKNASIEGSHTKGSPQYTSKQKEGGLPNKNASIKGPHIKHSPEHIPKQEEEGPPNKNASIEGSHTKGSPQYTSKQKEGGLPNKNASIEGPHIKHSPEHIPKQEEEGPPNKNASIEGSHTKDSPPYSSNQKEGGLPNKNTSIEGPHIKHSPEHIPKQEEEGSPNKNASIEGSHTKGSPQYSSKQKEGRLPNKNASIEGPHIKHSPEHIPKQEEEGPPNKNASIEGSHTKGSPQYSSKQKEGGLPNKNASIEEPYIKHSPEHLPKQEEEGLPNKNASIEGSHTKDSPQYSSKQKEGRLPNKNASIEGPYIKHSQDHLPKQEEEGSPNKNTSIKGSYTKGSLQYSSKQKEGGLPNKNASIEGPHIKHSPERLPKQEEEGPPNKNDSIEGSHTKDSPPYSSNQKEEGLPNKNASIEGPHLKHSPEHLPKQEEKGSPNKNASIKGSHTKGSPQYSSKQKEEGFPNTNVSIEGPHTKDRSQHLSYQEEGSMHKNASTEGPHTKDSPQYSSKQKEEGLPNKNASIEGPDIEHSPQNLPKQEEEGFPNTNVSIEGSHTKDSPQHLSNREKGLPNENASFEGPHIKDRSQHLSYQEDGSIHKNASIEGPHTKVSPQYSSKQKEEESLNTNVLIEDPHRKDSLQYSSRLDKEGPPNKNASIDGIHLKDSSQYSTKTRQEKQDSLKQELSKQEISELIIPPKEDYVEIIDTANNTDSFLNHKDETQSNILFPRKYTQEKPLGPTQKLDLKEVGNENKDTITQNKEDSIEFKISESKFSQKSRSLSEPEINKRQALDSSYILQNDAYNVPIPNDIKESKNIKVGENDNITFQSHNDNKLLESYDFSSARRSSQIDRTIKDDSSIIKRQLQSPKDTENTGLSTEEMINENRNYTSELTITDAGFRKLGSVNSETNLFGEHGIDIGNKKHPYEDETQWKAALRTGGTELEDDYDSSASPSIIKSTKDKGVMSPEKRVVIPMYHTGSTDTITIKTREIRDEFGYPSNELDKKLSNIKTYVRSASVSSSIPSTSTLKSVLKRETVAVDLAFQSYLNEKNERVLRTFDTITEPKRYVNDSITLVKSQVRLSANEIRIPVDSENDMFIQIKKASVNQHVHISESELQTDTKHDLKSSESKYPHEMTDRDFLHDSLLEIYDQELVPLQMIIKALKDEIDSLASQQMAFKEKVFSPKKSKPTRVVHTNRRCGCLKKIN